MAFRAAVAASVPMKPTYKRRRFRLLRPALQLRLMAAFGGVGLLALGLQFLLFYRAVGEASLASGSADAAVVKEISSSLLVSLFASIAVLLPLVIAIGTSFVLRFVGPIYRFEMWIGQVLGGGDPGPCRLRTGDELQELGALIDALGEERRRANAEDTSEDASGPLRTVADAGDEKERRAA